MATANLDDFRRDARSAIRRHRILFLIPGVVMVILGLLAAASPFIATLVVETFAGWLFLTGGFERVYNLCSDRMRNGGYVGQGAGRESMEDAMHFAKINMTTFSVGLVVSVLGLGMLLSSPANAKQRNRQQPAYGDQSYSGGVTVMPRNTPRANVVCWTPCNQPGAIVMGADPDPFIRQQLLRDADGFFGGNK
jgi:hypothetical protein